MEKNIFRFVIISLVLLFGFLPKSRADESGKWVSLGGPTADIWCIAVAGNDLYVVTGYDEITENGLHHYQPNSGWKLEKKFYPSYHDCLKTNGKDVFLKTGHEVLELKAGSHEWLNLPEIPRKQPTGAPTTIILDSNKVYGLMTQVESGGLYELASDGNSWSQVKIIKDIIYKVFPSLIRDILYVGSATAVLESDNQTRFQILKLDIKHHTLSPLPLEKFPRELFITDMVAAGDDLFIGSNVGLFKVVTTTNKWSLLSLTPNGEMYIRSLAVDSTGDIYLASERDGVFKLRVGLGQLTRVSQGLPKISREGSGKPLSYSSIEQLAIDGSSIYAGVQGKGIYRLFLH